mmetsp:Transcript_18810/g.36906  ORF Transcript_18810/g.36906 Transcript_18810/m.36906 type:complete len:294 (-) Transcript_18810:57-938(-)
MRHLHVFFHILDLWLGNMFVDVADLYLGYFPDDLAIFDLRHLDDALHDFHLSHLLYLLHVLHLRFRYLFVDLLDAGVHGHLLVHLHPLNPRHLHDSFLYACHRHPNMTLANLHNRSVNRFLYSLHHLSGHLFDQVESLNLRHFYDVLLRDNLRHHSGLLSTLEDGFHDLLMHLLNGSSGNLPDQVNLLNLRDLNDSFMRHLLHYLLHHLLDLNLWDFNHDVRPLHFGILDQKCRLRIEVCPRRPHCHLLGTDHKWLHGKPLGCCLHGKHLGYWLHGKHLGSANLRWQGARRPG